MWPFHVCCWPPTARVWITRSGVKPLGKDTGNGNSAEKNHTHKMVVSLHLFKQLLPHNYYLHFIVHSSRGPCAFLVCLSYSKFGNILAHWMWKFVRIEQTHLNSLISKNEEISRWGLTWRHIIAASNLLCMNLKLITEENWSRNTF